MSELEKQLNTLRVKNSITSSSLYSNTPSLFFNSKEAGSIDINEIFSSALNSLEILIQYDNRFNQFIENILHTSSINLQRELQTIQVRISFTNLKIFIFFVLLSFFILSI